jgi:hypothetical protein
MRNYQTPANTVPTALKGLLLRFWYVADEILPPDTDIQNPSYTDAREMLDVLSNANSENALISWIRSNGKRGCAALRDASVQYAHLEYCLVLAPDKISAQLTQGLELNAATFRSAGASAFFRRAIEQYAWSITEVPPERA